MRAHADNEAMITVPNIANVLFRETEPTPCAARERETMAPAFCAIDCPGRCPLLLHLRDGELSRVRPRKDAQACHRGLSMRAWANSPDRLMWPLRRVGPRGTDRFERITWDEALDITARELSRIRNDFGNDAIYLAYSTGQSCTMADPFDRLLNCFGGHLGYYNSYSNPQINAMVRHLYGAGALSPGGSELDAAADAELVVMFGSSPAETGTARASAHGAWDRVVKSVGERGGHIVMVDPRRNGSMPARAKSAEAAPSAGTTSSAGAADAAQTVSWIPIIPGTDGALAAALLHELAFTHRALDEEFLRDHCIGFTDDTLPEHRREQHLSVIDYLDGFGYDQVAKTPAWAANITGISEDGIKALAQRLAQARPAFIMQGWGPQRRSNGEMTSGMIMLLAIALGQIGLPGTNNGMNIAWGGGFLTRISAGENCISASIPSYRFLDAVEDGPSLGSQEGVRGLPSGNGASEHGADDAILSEEPNRGCSLKGNAPERPHLTNSIKAIVCHGGNCLTNQHGNVNRAHRVLGDPSLCEFILNIDVEFTDSARYADIVLPDLFRMEQTGVMDADVHGRRIAASSGALGGRFERRGAWDICRELAKRWGIEERFTRGKTEIEWTRDLYESDRERDASLPPFEQLIEQGVCYRTGIDSAPFTALADWRCDPIAHPLDTPSGKIEIFSESLAHAAKSLQGTSNEGSITPIPTYVPEWGPEEYVRESNAPLRAFGYHSIARIHSSWGNVPSVSKRVAQVISVNPADAQARDIGTGDIVEASNRFGTIRLPALVTEDVIAGTIIMPQGAWWKAGEAGTAGAGVAGPEPAGAGVADAGATGAGVAGPEPADVGVAGAGATGAGTTDTRSADAGATDSEAAGAERTREPFAIAPVDVGGCINTLTSSRPSPLAFGNPQHTCWCHLRKP